MCSGMTNSFLRKYGLWYYLFSTDHGMVLVNVKVLSSFLELWGKLSRGIDQRTRS